MAGFIIDEFKVKPAGFLASWRYRRVLVDDNGVVNSVGVIGKPDMNLPCISDYRKSDRRYKTGDLITTFCNRTTFTNYRVYAQDCDPFAYVQTDINFPACGYLAPAPTPANTPGIPPVAVTFPAPSYGLYKYLEDCTIDDEALIVNIYKRNYSGASSRITTGLASPVTLTYHEPSKKEYGIQILECSLNFISDSNFGLYEFYTNDERQYKIEVIVAGVTKFKGFATPDGARQAFQAPPNEVTIRANDGIGGLKNVTYPMPNGSKSNLRQKFIDVLSFALYTTNLDLGFLTTVNLFETKMLTGLNNDPLGQASVNPLRMSDGQGNLYDAYSVIEALCEQFHATFRQVDGTFQFIRVNEMANEVVRRRVYNKDAVFLRGENFAPLRTAGKSDEDVIITGGNPEISIGNAYKRVEVLMKYGDIPSIIFNGDFEEFTDPTYPFWTKVGGIDITRIQRTVKGSGGVPVDIDNYAVQFNQKADITKYFMPDAVPVLKGDKVTFGVRVGPWQLRRSLVLKIRFKVGNNYLYNDIDNNPDTYEWINSLSTAVLFIAESANPVYYQLPMPEIPINGNLEIQIFGFECLQTGFTDSNPVVWIDDVTLNNNSELDKNSIDGLLSVSDQNAFYTLKPERIELIFGDYSLDSMPTRPDRAPQPTIQNNLFAIYTSDGSYSTGWYEYGMSKSPVPIGLAIARSILKAHQRPYLFMNTDLTGDDLSVNDIYQISVPSETDFSAKKFCVLAGTYDLKHKRMLNGLLMEIFNASIVTNDANVPHVVSTFEIKEQLSMSIDQNPDNNPGDGAGIFTEQFTQEFS